VAGSTIEMQRPPHRNDWFDDECAAATSLKNRAYMSMLAKKNTRRETEAWKGLMAEMEQAGRH
jgi:hypothetical protein